MKNIIRINTPLTDKVCDELNTGDMVLLSGEIYTGRDVAHRKLFEAILRGDRLPVNLEGETIFYAAPTPARPDRLIGSVGPTTSLRMDKYSPKLMEMGIKGMIGKGKRSPEVIKAIKRFNTIYFGAIGGVAALTAQCVKRAVVAAYDELGPEAMMRLEIVDLPLVVINDTEGRDLYDEAVERYCMHPLVP